MGMHLPGGSHALARLREGVPLRDANGREAVESLVPSSRLDLIGAEIQGPRGRAATLLACAG